MAVADAAGYRDMPPSQIVPILADEGSYIVSESTMYRILREEKLFTHRSASRPRRHRRPAEYEATGPNQVWLISGAGRSWDGRCTRGNPRSLRADWCSKLAGRTGWTRRGWWCTRTWGPDEGGDVVGDVAVQDHRGHHGRADSSQGAFQVSRAVCKRRKLRCTCSALTKHHFPRYSRKAL